MDRADCSEVLIIGAIESAANVCFVRAEDWCEKSREASRLADYDMSEEYLIKRDEADACKDAIRGIVTVPLTEKDLVRLMAKTARILDSAFRKPEYSQANKIFTSIYEMMGGDDSSWPFPSQPCTPPFAPIPSVPTNK